MRQKIFFYFNPIAISLELLAIRKYNNFLSSGVMLLVSIRMKLNL